MKTLIWSVISAGVLMLSAETRPVAAYGARQISAAPAGARRAVQQSYRRFTIAESSLNYGRIKDASESFLAPDFTLHTATGHTLDREKFMKEMELVTHEVVSVTEDKFHSAGVTRHGATLSDTGTYVFTRIERDADGAYGKKDQKHLVSEQMAYQATWTVVDGQWRLQTLRMLGDKLKVDGKRHVVV